VTRPVRLAPILDAFLASPALTRTFESSMHKDRVPGPENRREPRLCDSKHVASELVEGTAERNRRVSCRENALNGRLDIVSANPPTRAF